MLNFLFHRKTSPPGNPASAGEVSLPFSGSVVSDAGRVRPNNEDNYVLGKYINLHSAAHSEVSVSFSDTSGQWQLAGVFDGMGGGEMGELASHDTAEIFLRAFGNVSGESSKSEIDLILRKAFLEANNRIVDLQQDYKIYGTTGTLLCTNSSVFKIYHLGDSRAYLIRDNTLMQLTKDQTLAQMKLDVGMYRPDDPSTEADKHKLTEYIGRDWTRDNLHPVESQWIPLQPRDLVLLCSDGLYDMCDDDVIVKILNSAASPGDGAASLTAAALEQGGTDNITCMVISFG